MSNPAGTSDEHLKAPNLSGLSYLISQEIESNAPLCIVVTNNSQVNRLERELAGLLPGDTSRIKKLPDIETLPYDMTQPHPALLSERMETLYALTHEKNPVVIVSLPASVVIVIPPAPTNVNVSVPESATTSD